MSIRNSWWGEPPTAETDNYHTCTCAYSASYPAAGLSSAAAVDDLHRIDLTMWSVWTGGQNYVGMGPFLRWSINCIVVDCLLKIDIYVSTTLFNWMIYTTHYTAHIYPEMLNQNGLNFTGINAGIDDDDHNSRKWSGSTFPYRFVPELVREGMELGWSAGERVTRIFGPKFLFVIRMRVREP